MAPSLRPLLPLLAGLSASTVLIPAQAWATCTPAVTGNPATTCSGTTDLGTTPLGNGQNGPDNKTIIVDPGATVSAGNSSAISLRDGAVITIGAGATVTSA